MPETAETRRFAMHPALLLDVIQRQAGTLSKAVLEGVMNAVDAKATECKITLNKELLTICDNGKGFSGREEIVKFFEVFGQPHAAEEHKTYGCFRMGRGQLFAFGPNKWHSGRYYMAVDIKSKGLDYELANAPHNISGCNIYITLYDQLTNVGLAETIRDIKRMVKFVAMKVKLNGDLISTDPAGEKWTDETDDGYVLINKLSSLQIYNLGVFVRDYPASQFGTGGVVVSKVPFKVNFARNDVMSDCKVWQRLKRIVDKYGTQDNLKKESLDDSGRQHMIDKLMNGEVKLDDVENLRLIKDVNGRCWTIRSMLRNKWGWKDTVTVVSEGHRIGCRIHDARIAFVISTETLDQFGCKGVMEFKSVIQDLIGYTLHGWKFITFEVASKGFNDQTLEVPTKDYTELERLWVRVLTSLSGALQCSIDHKRGRRDYRTGRNILVGMSGANLEAWTNGESYVCFDRDYLAKHELDLPGLLDVGLTLWHEYCHDTDDRGSHKHGVEFYQEFHDGVDDAVRCIWDRFGSLGNILEAAGRRLTKKQLKLMDKVDDTEAKRQRAAALIGKVEALAAKPAPVEREERSRKKQRELTDL